MTMKTTLALEWELEGHDSKLAEEIQEDIDCENDEELLPDSSIGSASIREIRVVSPPWIVGL
jgi:hypothetical protein